MTFSNPAANAAAAASGYRRPEALGKWPEQLERAGLHSERGLETTGDLLRLLAAHDLVHRRQIDRILSSPR